MLDVRCALFIIILSRIPINILSFEPTTIKILRHKLLTDSVVSRDFHRIFDYDKNTQAIIHSDKDEEIRVLLYLAGEYRLENVEIITDLPELLEQMIYVGYESVEDTPFFGSRYECAIKKTSTSCNPACQNQFGNNSRSGVIGRNVLWTFKRNSKGWTRVYDVILTGISFEGRIVVKNKVADITLYKPYTDHSVPSNAMESCDGQLSHLIDATLLNSSAPASSTTDRNMTIYFGRMYSVREMRFIISTAQTTQNQIVLHFRGMESIDKIINLSTDCKITDPTFGLYNCDLSTIENYSFNQITLNVNSLIKLHIYGMPFYYPRVGISTDSEPDKNVLQFTCVSLACGATLSEGYPNLEISQSTDTCTQYGKTVTCEEMDLIRLPVQLDSTTEPIQLTTGGHIRQEIISVMTQLKIVESTNERLVATVPRTHHYYGRYQCSCRPNDKKKSQIKSPPTEPKVQDYDQGDLVFQRNYTAIFSNKTIDSVFGIIELPQSAEGAFFRLVILGHSLIKDIKLNASFIETGRLTSTTGAYAETTQVKAFPKAPGSDQAWPLNVYKIKLQEAWPDAIDDNLIQILWTANEFPRTVEDQLRTIIVQPKNSGRVRAWIWDRNVNQLDIRAYYQFDPESTEPITHRLKLQSSGCANSTSPETELIIDITNNICKSDNMDNIQCKYTQSGLVLQILLKNPPATDEYNFFISEDAKSKTGNYTKIITSSALIDKISTQFPDLETTVNAVWFDETNGNTHLDIAVNMNSKIIVDISKCESTSLTITIPAFQQSKQTLPVTSETVQAKITVPTELQIITMELEIVIGSGDKAKSKKYSQKFSNPKYIKMNMVLDETNSLIEWSTPEPIFKNLITDYKTTIKAFIRICNQTRQYSLPVSCAKKTVCELRISDTNDFTATSNGLLIDYTVTVNPVFESQNNSTLVGPDSMKQFRWGVMGQTNIKLFKDTGLSPVLTKLLVQPGQIIDCLNSSHMSTDFTLRVIGEGDESPAYLDSVQYVPSTNLDEDGTSLGRWYNIENLLPGRRYEISAQLLYPIGDKEQLSKPTRFWTNDEVYVQTSTIYASPGDDVEVNCTGSVGPSEPYPKHLEWKTLNGSRLSDGGRSINIQIPSKAPKWLAVESLKFYSIEMQHSGVYACFIQPSVIQLTGGVEHHPTVTVIVSDLKLDKLQTTAQIGDTVIANCQTNQSGELNWFTSTGEKIDTIDPNKADEYAKKIHVLQQVQTAETGLSSSLVIPNIKLDTAGSYVCKHTPSDNKRTFRVEMKENISLTKLSDCSEESSEQLCLLCNATIGHRGQLITWYKRDTSNPMWIKLSQNGPTQSTPYEIDSKLSNTLTNENLISKLKVINSPATNGHFLCAIEYPHEVNIDRLELQLVQQQQYRAPDFTKITNAQIEVVVKPVLKIISPTKSQTGEIHIKCESYPGHIEDRLYWFFAPKGNKNDLIPIGQHVFTEDVMNADKIVVDSVKTAFKFGETIPATWPGYIGPQTLVTSPFQTTSTGKNKILTPESLELILDKSFKTKYSSTMSGGTLVCQLRRAKSIYTFESNTNHQRTVLPNPDSFDLIIERKIAINDVMDAGKLPIRGSSSINQLENESTPIKTKTNMAPSTNCVSQKILCTIILSIIKFVIKN